MLLIVHGYCLNRDALQIDWFFKGKSRLSIITNYRLAKPTLKVLFRCLITAKTFMRLSLHIHIKVQCAPIISSLLSKLLTKNTVIMLCVISWHIVSRYIDSLCCHCCFTCSPLLMEEAPQCPHRSSSQEHVLGAVSIRKTVLPGMAIPMLKIRRPNGRLIFNLEITIRR